MILANEDKKPELFNIQDEIEDSQVCIWVLVN